MENKLQTTRTWVEIDKNAVIHNYSKIRELVPKGCSVMAIVKADAYGHGASEIAGLLSDKADCFGVASAYEAVELRKNGIENDILILGGTDKELFSQLIEYDIMPSIFDYNSALYLSEAAGDKRVGCFIALDTGMSRIGFGDRQDGIDGIKKISELKNIDIKGIFSHFACADEKDKSDSLEQISRFKRFCNKLDELGISVGKRCLSNSAGIIELDAFFDMVRAGIVLYGIYPSKDVDKSKVLLRPVLSLKTRVELVKTVPAGTGVSYGHTYITEKETRIATLCAGYADGVPRMLSNNGDVLIRGKRASIIGRICMDQMTVDVTDIEGVTEGDIATVIGRDGDASISVDEVAEAAHTISYEILCAMSKPRLPRIYF